MSLANDEYKIRDVNNYLPASTDIDSEPESLEDIAAKCKEIGFGVLGQTIIFWLLD